VVLSRREKIIAATLGGVIALFAVDRYALTPYLDTRSRVVRETEVVTNDLEKADRLLANRRRVEEAWRELQETGLKTDQAAAESLTLHSLRDWAQNARVSVQTLKTDRAIRAGDFLQIRLQVSGTANVAALAQFLASMESAKFPLRINEFRANARKEGIDDLTFNMTVSTLAYSPDPEKKSANRPAARRAQ